MLPSFLRRGHTPARRPEHTAIHVLARGDDDQRRASRDEATIPLTSFDPDNQDDDDDDDDPSSSPATTTRRSSASASKRSSSAAARLAHRFPTRRVLALLVVAVALYKLHRHLDYGQLHSHLNDYSARYNPWHPKPPPIAYVDVSPHVRIKGRRYRAHHEHADDRYWAWKAMPYAQPPTGQLRFRVSRPLEELNEADAPELTMDRWDPGCVRPRPRDDRKDGPHDDYDGHEDCLKCVTSLCDIASLPWSCLTDLCPLEPRRINVFAPQQRPNNTLLPVMFWIHGGGFIGGTSAEDKYDPRDLMKRGIDLELPFVFVSIKCVPPPFSASMAEADAPPLMTIAPASPFPATA